MGSLLFSLIFSPTNSISLHDKPFQAQFCWEGVIIFEGVEKFFRDDDECLMVLFRDGVDSTMVSFREEDTMDLFRDDDGVDGAMVLFREEDSVVDGAMVLFSDVDSMGHC